MSSESSVCAWKLEASGAVPLAFVSAVHLSRNPGLDRRLSSRELIIAGQDDDEMGGFPELRCHSGVPFAIWTPLWAYKKNINNKALIIHPLYPSR